MVLFKSLQCCECKGRCYPYFREEADWALVFVQALCDHCQNEICCGQCTLIVKECAETGKEWWGLEESGIEHSRFFYILAYFDKYAPADEIGLLSRQRWSPLFCRKCSSTKIVTDDGIPFCPVCDRYYALQNRKRLKDFLHTRLLELNDMFLPDDRKAIIAKGVKLQSQECCDCRTAIETRHIATSEDGRLRCRGCRKGKCFDFHSVECMFYFFEFLNHIPDMDDLRVLTYSKWSPLKCEKCSVFFSEIEDRMPMLNNGLRKIVCQKCSEQGNTSFTFIKLHFLVDWIKEFRHYFKNNGIDCLPSQRLEPMPRPKALSKINKIEMNNMPSSSTNSKPCNSKPVNTRGVADLRNKDPESMAPLTTHPDSYFEKKLLRISLIPEGKATIPDTLRCQCGRYEELAEMKDCSTCNENAFCSRCIIKNHWGHQITDTVPELIVAVVNSEADKIKSKLRKWRGWLAMTQNKVVVRRQGNIWKLVTTYETLFLKALESKNPDKLRELLQLLDTHSDIDELLMDSMNDIFKKLAKIDDFCVELKQ